MNKIYIYAARDTSTGKLVNDISNPKRKYWDRKANAVKAIEDYNKNYANKRIPWNVMNRGAHATLELVTYELVEVKDNA
jgi:hypothetical protein